MEFQVTLLGFGILLLLLGLIGKVKAKEIDVGTSSPTVRVITTLVGLTLIVLSFNPEVVKPFISSVVDQEEPAAACENSWEWDSNFNRCVKRIDVPSKTFSIPLDTPITKVSGNIYLYTNRERLADKDGVAKYRENKGALQAVIPVMLEKRMVGELREIIYSTKEGEICALASLPETTGHLKNMQVAYSLGLATECQGESPYCSARLIQSGKRMHVVTKKLTMIVAENCQD